MTISRFIRTAALALITAAAALADNAVEGSLTANGNVVPLRSVIVETGLGEVSLLMTDEPLPAGCGVYDAFTLVDSGRLRGMAVSISKDTRKIESAGLNALYHESWNGRLGNIGEPEVTIAQLDDKILKGAISLPSGAFGDHKFSYNSSFQVDLSPDRPVIEAKVSGAGDSQAAQAYVKYYEAMMAGRLEDGKQYVTAENAKQMTGDDAELFLELFQDGHPRAATITGATEEGDKAELTVEGEVAGCMATSHATAKVDMVKESGVWKVELESWEM
jgi:hypothetical protein